MSTPDLVVAARRMLVTKPDLVAAVGTSSEWSQWIFQNSSYVEIENTGSACIIVSRSGGWASPNLHNTARFPVLQFEIMSDCDRDVNRRIKDESSAERRCFAIYDILDKYLHIVFDAQEQYWGGTGSDDPLRIISCVRQGEPGPTVQVPGKSGVRSLFVRYNITL